jgi:hypothetical protein
LNIICWCIRAEVGSALLQEWYLECDSDFTG